MLWRQIMNRHAQAMNAIDELLNRELIGPDEAIRVSDHYTNTMCRILGNLYDTGKIDTTT